MRRECEAPAKKREPHTRLSLSSCSEREVVGLFRIGRCSVGAVAQHAEFDRHNFGRVAGAASVLGLVLTRLEPSLDVDLVFLGKQTLAVISEVREGDHAVPFNPLLTLALAIRELCLSRDRQADYPLTRGQRAAVRDHIQDCR